MTACLFYISQRCMLPRANAVEFTFSQWAFREFSWSCWEVDLEMRQKRLKQHWSHLTSGKNKQTKTNHSLTAVLLSAPDWGWRGRREEKEQLGSLDTGLGEEVLQKAELTGQQGAAPGAFSTSTPMPHFVHGHWFGAWEGEVDRVVMGHLQYQVAKQASQD